MVTYKMGSNVCEIRLYNSIYIVWLNIINITFKAIVGFKNTSNLQRLREINIDSYLEFRHLQKLRSHLPLSWPLY